MKIEDLLSRRFDPIACKIVGTKIKVQGLLLKEKDKNFPAKLSEALDAFNAGLDALISALPSGVSIKTVDNSSDRSVGGFRALLEAIEDTLHPVDYLSISPEALARGENARKLLLLAYPKGTAFLKAKHQVQWVEMGNLIKRLESEEARALISELRLEDEVKRLHQWFILYGEKKNITTEEEDFATQIQAKVDHWHKSYAKLITQALSFYDDEDNKEHLEKREVFLAPYQEQLQQIREEEKAYRDKLKKKKEDNTI